MTITTMDNKTNAKKLKCNCIIKPLLILVASVLCLSICLISLNTNHLTVDKISRKDLNEENYRTLHVNIITTASSYFSHNKKVFSTR